MTMSLPICWDTIYKIHIQNLVKIGEKNFTYFDFLATIQFMKSSLFTSPSIAFD